VFGEAFLRCCAAQGASTPLKMPTASMSALDEAEL
jgi:hypothetical protein